MRLFTEDVFGVSSQKVIESFIKRDEIESSFLSALRSHKQIVVYGSSKQGKTLLVRTHLNSSDTITIELSPNMNLTDLYRAILRQAGVAIQLRYEEGTGKSLSSTIKSRFSAAVALIAKGEIEAGVTSNSQTDKKLEFETISFNLALPQDVGELLRKIKFNKPIILENFHYLSEENQKAFSIDLRSFADMNFRFIILGVWQDHNHLLQFNGDLVDRLSEVTVEPWLENDFKKIIEKGSRLLNIELSDEIINRCIDCSFGNVGIFQELIKETLLNSDIRTIQHTRIRVDSDQGMLKAIESKRCSYSVRSARALETLATSNSVRTEEENKPFYLNYYLVIAILKLGFDGIKKGLTIDVLFKKIRSFHHRPHDLKKGQLTRILYKISENQNKKSIQPPIFFYDRYSKKLRIVDATFLYFIRNAPLKSIIKDIPSPCE